jgi:hypothetical protein
VRLEPAKSIVRSQKLDFGRTLTAIGHLNAAVMHEGQKDVTGRLDCSWHCIPPFICRLFEQSHRIEDEKSRHTREDLQSHDG